MLVFHYHNNNNLIMILHVVNGLLAVVSYNFDMAVTSVRL